MHQATIISSGTDAIFMQIHVEAYIFTLATSLASHSNAKPDTPNIPIDATAWRDSSSNSFGAKPVSLKGLDIPRPQTRTSDHTSPTHLQSSIDDSNLLGCIWCLRIEPVHAVHENGNGESLWLHSCHDFAEFVRVDSQSVKR